VLEIIEKSKKAPALRLGLFYWVLSSSGRWLFVIAQRLDDFEHLFMVDEAAAMSQFVGVDRFAQISRLWREFAVRVCELATFNPRALSLHRLIAAIREVRREIGERFAERFVAKSLRISHVHHLLMLLRFASHTTSKPNSRRNVITAFRIAGCDLLFCFRPSIAAKLTNEENAVPTEKNSSLPAREWMGRQAELTEMPPSSGDLRECNGWRDIKGCPAAHRYSKRSDLMLRLDYRAMASGSSRGLGSGC